MCVKSKKLIYLHFFSVFLLAFKNNLFGQIYLYFISNKTFSFTIMFRRMLNNEAAFH